MNAVPPLPADSWQLVTVAQHLSEWQVINQRGWWDVRLCEELEVMIQRSMTIGSMAQRSMTHCTSSARVCPHLAGAAREQALTTLDMTTETDSYLSICIYYMTSALRAGTVLPLAVTEEHWGAINTQS
jgi:hypothetical protein